MKLPLSFYRQSDVVAVAKELIGKQLFSTIDNKTTGGIIIETEAYRGPEDKACHAYNNRRTPRTEVMFQNGGIAYVYFCYGMHHLLNIVTSVEGEPHAILIRALQPTHGLETMAERRNKKPDSPLLANGPGALCQALGITRAHNGHSLLSSLLWLEEAKSPISSSRIKATPRIGIDYAGEDAALPWRFILDNLAKSN